MPEEISYTELTHNVVRESEEPLTSNEIVERVHAIRPITTKNPKKTIRGAISQSHMIVNTGEGRYGWKPRVITGSILRHTLFEGEIVRKTLEWDEDMRDALWPNFFGSEKYGKRDPVAVTLPNGEASQLILEHFGQRVWGSRATPGFWEWLEGRGAAPGDHLIIRLVDGMAPQCAVEYQPRRERDEQAIDERNVALIQASVPLLERPYGAAPWDVTSHLLATGFYKHPVPPDPFSEVWSDELWELQLDELEGFDDEVLSALPDPLLEALFGAGAMVYDVEQPPDLPREYDPARGRRRPRPSAKAQKGSVTTYTLRVNHRALPDVWRDIELAEDQTLEDLHLAFQQAYGWSDDHLYSFFLSGQPWDSESEIGSPWSDSAVHTHQVQLGEMGLEEGSKFLYLFDYGDGHEFDVTVLRVSRLGSKDKYPRILDYHGSSPDQYPEIDEETGEWSWDPYRHKW